MLTKRHRESAERAVEKLLQLLVPGGIDNPDMQKTPARVVRMYEEMFRASGSEVGGDLPFEFTTFESEHDQLIVARNVRFASMCSHHLLPFFGTVHVGYLPSGQICGWSKMSRLVQHCAASPQTQETLTERIADEMVSRLRPKAVLVAVTAVHTCSRVRGVKDPESEMVTSTLRGTGINLRDEFFNLIRMSP